jgi:hypothetical protein
VATQFFSTVEIRKLESWPVEFGRDELVRYFTLTPEDVAWVNKSARGTPAKLGLAVQLCASTGGYCLPDDPGQGRIRPGLNVSDRFRW